MLTVVAHPDDDLFFINPDLANDLQAGVCTTTVYVTSGDAGQRNAYHRARERGIAAAYAAMAGAPDVWARARVTVAGRVLTEATLTGVPSVRLFFLRLPDGGMDGSGWPRSARTSLRQLVQGQVPVLWTVDSPAQAYGAEDLLAVLSGVMTHVRPTGIRTLDGERGHADGDHSDHHTVAQLTAAASARWDASVPVAGYVGYPSAELPANVDGRELADKAATVEVYARFDRLLHLDPVQDTVSPEAAWLARRYRTVDVPTSR
ncbi:PIG-L family deacetylase [Modestobacter sp. VKM Ac-2986]|uniref:PIG-L family deacetylase n=1 Tax=Modestobacter sp. VKM Ac-2986 TaxID=3004140 RepID=UPI0022AB743A|nr:PIG-L family deacetylase [Modestobacter sp. VKM Ac-2986]MCZ2829873.1 PIG-L family deacetylase [Modestobacter sp. VKM Ac-2986]